jgi:large subunit ribosomal protein L17
MHRHGYKGRKLHRERDQRRALLKGLSDSLIKYEQIETTLTKAKEIVPYMEKLITKAKKGDLHSRRQVISSLQTVESAHKLVDDLAPKMGTRSSGHLRIRTTRLRRGDNAQLANISFVDDLKEDTKRPAKVTEAESEPAAKTKSITSKPKKTTNNTEEAKK